MLKTISLFSILSIAFINNSFAVQPITISDEISRSTTTPLIYTKQRIPIIERLQSQVIKDSTDNLSWEANYKVVLSIDQRTAELSGFITLNNQSDEDYINKNVQFTVELPTSIITSKLYHQGCILDKKESYHIFQLPNKMSLMRGQTEIIPFLSVQNIPITKECHMMNSLHQDNPIDINCFYHIDRDALNLKTPLPNGAFQLYNTLNDSSKQLIQTIEPKNIHQTYNHLSNQKYISLDLGKDSNIFVNQAITQGEISPNDSSLFKYQMILTNPTDEDITISYFWEKNKDFELTDLSHPITTNLPFYTRNQSNNADFIAWQILIPAKGKSTFSYTAKLK